MATDQSQSLGRSVLQNNRSDSAVSRGLRKFIFLCTKIQFRISLRIKTNPVSHMSFFVTGFM